MDKLYRTIRFEIKDLNEEDRSFTAIASDNSTDRHGESIDQSGWNLENYIKNPVVPWGHDYYMPPVAKAVEIGLVDNKLMFRPKFATKDEYAWADTIFKLYKGGYLRAFSVGFVPEEMDGNVFKKQELLEISAVTVPSNPNALALAFKEGIIDDSERKMLIDNFNVQIKRLTNIEHKKDNGIDMEELKLLTESVAKLTALVEEQGSTIAELKTTLEDVQTKMVVKDVEDESNDVDDEDKSEEAIDANSSDESSDDGADDDNKEVSDEEAEKLIEAEVQKALNEASGKVE